MLTITISVISLMPFSYATSVTQPTIFLDKTQYTWTDKVKITVIAPDQNLDPNKIDTIGNTTSSKITISTRGHSISSYKLVETGPNTGIFTGNVTLTGDPNIKGTSGVDGYGTNPTGLGPSGIGSSDGLLPTQDSDGLSVSFQTQNQTVTASAPIRWNIGTVSWSSSNYTANGQGVCQIIDHDMSLNPNTINTFYSNVWSDTDSGGIRLNMTETGKDTGIFQGTVYFTNSTSSGNQLHVSTNDTVTCEYVDRTLPVPYLSDNQLGLFSTAHIEATSQPPEKVLASNPRIVDPFGNIVTGPVNAGQQIQIAVDLTNNRITDQPFAYLVQIQDQNGVTVSLSWITGTLTANQSLNPAQSWTPTASGTYTAQIFILQSIDNPLPLSQTLATTITVEGGQPVIYDTIPVSLSETVNPPIQDDTATLLILDPNNNLVHIAQASVTNDGKFSTIINAGGPLFRVTGIYTVKIEYGGTLQNNLSFNYGGLTFSGFSNATNANGGLTFSGFSNATNANGGLTFSGFSNATNFDILPPSSNGTSISNFDCNRHLANQTSQLSSSFNQTSAILLAKNSTEFQSIVSGYNYGLASSFMTASFNKTTCNITSFDWNLVFEVTSGGNPFEQVYVEEDPLITRILNIWVNTNLEYYGPSGPIEAGPASQSTSASVSMPNGTVTTVSTSHAVTNLQAIPDSSLSSVGKPLGMFPYGLLSWKITGLAIGQTVQVNFTYPSPIPSNAQYWKFNNGIWTNLSSLITGIHGNILTINITDGGLGDSDGLANGIISDPGGIFVPSLIAHSGDNTPGAPPSFTTGFGMGEYPLTINGINYNLGNYSNTGQIVTVQTGKQVAMKLLLEGDQGPSSVKHVSVFMDLHGKYNSLLDSDASITWDSAQPLVVSDPNHYFGTITANTTSYDNKLALLFDLTFAKPMATSDIGFRVWGIDLYSKDTYLMHALDVIPAQAITPSAVAPSGAGTGIDIIQSIKEWGGYSSITISDSELLNDMGIKASHIPMWVTKTTKFVVNGQMTEQDFENIIKYLDSIGIIK